MSRISHTGVLLAARDCTPLDLRQPGVDTAWLARLATVSPKALTLPLSGSPAADDSPSPGEDDAIVYCERNGQWWTGRFIGSITFEGRTLTIQPRLGLAALRNWLAEATSVVLCDTPGQLRQDESFIVQLLASVWVQGFVEAARHGLPALRREAIHHGPDLRGRLDIRRSLPDVAMRSGNVVSMRAEKSLDHAASEAIVAAYAVLRRKLGGDQWMPPRAKDLMPHLLAATGARPRVPSQAELDRIRYTPITAAFAPLAALSRHIASLGGLANATEESGQAKGILLDVAELWEMYVLAILRKAASPLSVVHGTRDRGQSRRLLTSGGNSLGTLVPDALLLRHGEAVGVVDAKYKRLHAPAYPQREDLYQMAAYLGRYTSADETSRGMLVYPAPENASGVAWAEEHNPWVLDSRRQIAFLSLPHSASDAVAKMREAALFFTLGQPTTRAAARR